MARTQKNNQINRRLQLQAKLESILGSRQVYYQPPENIKIKYPAIVYERNDIDADHADNLQYFRHHRYMLTVIDRNPDSEIVEMISQLPMCQFSRHFTADGLNHDIFTIYF